MKMIKIVFCGMLLLTLSGCSNFLEESSQDEVRPATVDDMEQLLIGEIYMDGQGGSKGANWGKFCNSYTEMMTDDMQCNGLVYESDQSALENGRWMFSWDRDMFNENGGGVDIFLWEETYKRINGCNVVIEYLDKVTGDDTQRNNLKGEALTMRAFYYFYLVNFFGMPYNSGNPNEILGVPLNLDMAVLGEYFPRNTVAEVYEQIEKDLLEGLRLLEENPIERDFLRAGASMARAMLSRMYLYMEKWELAAQYAGAVIDERPQLLDFAQIDLNVFPIWDNVYVRNVSPEIIWARPGTSNVPNETLRKPVFGISDRLTSCLKEDYWEETIIMEDPFIGEYESYVSRGDLRSAVYGTSGWSEDAGGNYETFILGIEKDRADNYCGVRTAEMYLNRAEANIHLFIESGEDNYRVQALNDLNFLRYYRFTREDYKEKDITDADELLEFCKNERRRELCSECNHRWFDLRRYGMERIDHLYWVNAGETQTFTLEPGSSRWVLPIPEEVLDANLDLVPNL